MGNIQPEIYAKEHDGNNAVKVKRIGMYGWDIDNLQYLKIAVDSDGKLKVDIGQ